MHELVATRFSPRAFLQDDVAAGDLRSLLAAASWAASAGNGQPWRFALGVRPHAAWEALADLLDEGNQAWARSAPVLGIAIAQVVRKERALATGPYDLGQAMAMLSLEATSRGLHVHQMAGFDHERARGALAIPEDFAPLAAFAIGHVGPSSALPDDLRARELAPRARRPLAETVFEGAFGTAAAWL